MRSIDEPGYGIRELAAPCSGPPRGLYAARSSLIHTHRSPLPLLVMLPWSPDVGQSAALGLLVKLWWSAEIREGAVWACPCRGPLLDQRLSADRASRTLDGSAEPVRALARRTLISPALPPCHSQN
jgi:hypothetical protein